ncbi:MAG TPA: FHA domain-containing protein [Anaerolineaceae bacterium]|nr:FHA domain-containing protein [Anaerolineaceae bacterium]
MSGLSGNFLLFIVAGSVLLTLWILSVGITCWDVITRRRLSKIESGAWIALVILIPGIGFLGYLLSRFLGFTLSPGNLHEEYPRRATKRRRSPEMEPRSGTILGADLLPSHQPKIDPLQETSTMLEGETRTIKLSIMAGPHNGADYIFKSLPIIIGRGNDVSLPLDEDLGVSRLHAEIYEQKGTLRIRDLHSTHGTKVNDLIISDNSLDTGDKIQIGVSILRISTQEERL